MNDQPPRPALDYPFPEPPAYGATLDVAPGLKWVRMPVPGPLGHINLWLLSDGDGWTIVDCGLPRAEVQAHWESVFASALDRRPVTRVIVTHFHADHFGSCGWLCRRWNILPWMTEREWLTARAVFGPQPASDATYRRDFYRAAGVAEALLDGLAEPAARYRDRLEFPPAYRRIRAGVPIGIGGTEWLPIIGRGHSPEHACLHAASAKILIGGDILLPRISPNVSVWPAEPAADPLADFLDSLDGFGAVPHDTLVLPAHGLPYRGLRARIAQLREHHAERLDRLVEALDQPRAAPALFSLLFRREIGADNLFLALGETLAHLHRLESQGRVVRRHGSDGVVRFVQRRA